MIRCNLAILLAERNLKITKVANDTGISRTTLTALCSNRSQGIQFDTFNTLCNYLGVTPDKILGYVPLDLEVFEVYLKPNKIINKETTLLTYVGMTVTKNGEKDCYDMNGQLELKKKKDGFEYIARLDFSPYITSTNVKYWLEFINILLNLPASFITDLENKIRELIYNGLGSLKTYVTTIIIIWPQLRELKSKEGAPNGEHPQD